MHAYNELYLGNAQRCLASMLQNAVYAAGLDLKEFYECFIHSRFSRLFERGVPGIVSGRSGIELMNVVLSDTALKSGSENIPQWEGTSRTPENWTGYVLVLSI